jgi:hypothetical protein
MTPWMLLIVGLGITIFVETIILAAALWIMIKIQKLNYNVLGLLGTAALTSAVDETLNLVLGHLLGDYLASYVSTPIVVVVLSICVAKLTEADPVDVAFTIVVGYAVWFCLNLWLLGSLLGDLRPSASHAEDDMGSATMGMEFQPENPPPKTNRLAISVPPTNPMAAKVAAPAKAPEKIATTTATNAPAPARPAAKAPKGFSLKGIISGGSPSAMINTGVRTYTVFQGDSLTMDAAGGPVTVRCITMETNRVVLDIDGEPVTLSLPVARR